MSRARLREGLLAAEKKATPCGPFRTTPQDIARAFMRGKHIEIRMGDAVIYEAPLDCGGLASDPRNGWAGKP